MTPTASPNTPSITELQQQLREFAAERQWESFHNPKNLVMALSVEAAELVECFQWLTPEQSATLSAAEHHAVSAEIADVLLYLLRLADILDIDPIAAAQQKIKMNAQKYPPDSTQGWPRKTYTP
jgi:NTP pyrophosphatase (non-canonical NTP hydrolase)